MPLFARLNRWALYVRHGFKPVKDVIPIHGTKYSFSLYQVAIFDHQQRRVNKLIKLQTGSMLLRPSYGAPKWFKISDRYQNLFALVQFSLQLDAGAPLGYISQYCINLENAVIRQLEFDQPFGPNIGRPFTSIIRSIVDDNDTPKPDMNVRY